MNDVKPEVLSVLVPFGLWQVREGLGVGIESWS